MKRKAVLLLTSMVMAAVLLGGCGKDKEEDSTSLLDDIQEETEAPEEVEATVETEEETEEVVEEDPEGMYRSELTNEWIDESLKDQRSEERRVGKECM